MNYFEFIQTDVQKQVHLPSFVKRVVNGFCLLHIYSIDWTFGRSFSKLSSTQQIETFALSAGAHFVGNYSQQMQASVNFLLVMKCAIDLTEQYQSLKHAYDEFDSAIKRNFPISNCFLIIDQKPSFSDSASTTLKMTHLSRGFLQTYFFSQISWLTTKLLILVLTLYNILKKTLILISVCFITSSCTRDVYLILKQDQRSRFRGCTLLFMNCSEYRQKLESNCQNVYEEILKKAVSVDCYLIKFGLVGLNAKIISSNLACFCNLFEKQYQIATKEGSNVLSSICFKCYIPNLEIPLPDLSLLKGNPNQEIAEGPFWKGEIVDLTEKIEESKKTEPSKSRWVASGKDHRSFSLFRIFSSFESTD